MQEDRLSAVPANRWEIQKEASGAWCSEIRVRTSAAPEALWVTHSGNSISRTEVLYYTVRLGALPVCSEKTDCSVAPATAR